MEIVVFPRDYEKNAAMMQTDARVFIQGRVSAEDDKPSKLICEKIFPFAGIPKELWIQFPDKETYEREVADLYQMLHESDGKDSVILYIKSIKAMKNCRRAAMCRQMPVWWRHFRQNSVPET